MAQVIFAKEAVVRAARDRVWSVVVDPARMPALDPRVQVVSATGPAGATASGYILDVRTPIRVARTACTVTESDPGVRIVTEARQGRRLVVQEGRLADAPEGGTRLAWIVRSEAPPGLGWLVDYRGRQELARWMAAVVAAAEGPD